MLPRAFPARSGQEQRWTFSQTLLLPQGQAPPWESGQMELSRDRPGWGACTVWGLRIRVFRESSLCVKHCGGPGRHRRSRRCWASCLGASGLIGRWDGALSVPRSGCGGCGIVASAGVYQAQTTAQARVGDAAWVKRLNQPLPLGLQSCDVGQPEAGSGGRLAPWAAVAQRAAGACGRALRKEGTFGLRPEEEVAVRQVRGGRAYVRACWGVQGRQDRGGLLYSCWNSLVGLRPLVDS